MMEVIDKKYRNDCFFENLKTGAIVDSPVRSGQEKKTLRKE